MTANTRLAQELKAFAGREVVHDLPSTYYYWSSTYLRARLNSTGYANFHDMFVDFIGRAYRAAGGNIRMVSIGSGNCDFEVMLARKMVSAGLTDFTFECLDINETMLERGRQRAEAAGFGGRMRFISRDFNTWVPDGSYNIFLGNQSLHHVVELEHLFDQIHTALRPDGYFLINDMIGRNGHMRWPEAEEIIQKIWVTLPEEKRFHNKLKRTFDAFYNHDSSTEGFEGIRAQDILPLLTKRFGFAYFMGFSSIITPFIGRGYGPNFDISKPEDKRFIDDIAVFDQALIDAGVLTPTQMFAVLTREAFATPIFDRHLTPEFCVRDPNEDRSRQRRS